MKPYYFFVCIAILALNFTVVGQNQSSLTVRMKNGSLYTIERPQVCYRLSSNGIPENCYDILGGAYYLDLYEIVNQKPKVIGQYLWNRDIKGIYVNSSKFFDNGVANTFVKIELKNGSLVEGIMPMTGIQGYVISPYQKNEIFSINEIGHISGENYFETTVNDLTQLYNNMGFKDSNQKLNYYFEQIIKNVNDELTSKTKFDEFETSNERKNRFEKAKQDVLRKYQNRTLKNISWNLPSYDIEKGYFESKLHFSRSLKISPSRYSGISNDLYLNLRVRMDRNQARDFKNSFSGSTLSIDYKIIEGSSYSGSGITIQIEKIYLIKNGYQSYVFNSSDYF